MGSRTTCLVVKLNRGQQKLKKRPEVGLLVAIVCLAAISAPVAAQQQFGGLRVLVTDQTGSVIPGAEVDFGGKVLIRPVFGVSDDHGLVIRNSLPPGNYTVTVRFPGFQTAVNEEVVVQAGRIFSVEIALKVGQLDSTIVVEAGQAAIDTFKSESAATYAGQGITDAPGGRDFSDYARFTPSVNIEAQAGNVTYRGQRVSVESPSTGPPARRTSSTSTVSIPRACTTG